MLDVERQKSTGQEHVVADLQEKLLSADTVNFSPWNMFKMPRDLVVEIASLHQETSELRQKTNTQADAVVEAEAKQASAEASTKALLEKVTATVDEVAAVERELTARTNERDQLLIDKSNLIEDINVMNWRTMCTSA